MRRAPPGPARERAGRRTVVSCPSFRRSALPIWHRPTVRDRSSGVLRHAFALSLATGFHLRPSDDPKLIGRQPRRQAGTRPRVTLTIAPVEVPGTLRRDERPPVCALVLAPPS